MTEGTTPQIRRLYRSRTDRVIGGVCGGIATYFRIDPVLVRVGAVASIFLGGAGLVLYVAALLLVPREGEDGGPGPGPSRPLAIAGVIVLVVGLGALLPFDGPWWDGWPLLTFGLLAVGGLLVWRFITGDRAGLSTGNALRAVVVGTVVLIASGTLAVGSAWAAASGGDALVAGIVIATGLALVAGAFLGPGIRWLILPALAIAIPAGVVGAADIDLDGGVGERTYRPATAADVRPSYEVGMGELVVDLRHVDLGPGDHHVKLDVGVGHARVVVPEDVCVASTAHLGMGGVMVFSERTGGVDVDWEDEPQPAAGNARVIVDAQIGLGAFTIDHEGDEPFDGRRPHGTNSGCAA